MILTTNEIYMQRCLDLAAKGLVDAMPNPSVGAVVVYKDTIIGEGFTSAFGGSHAEVNAINSVKNKDLLKECTLYVSLEPCNHFGKTPPCSDLIVHSKIPKVVIGCIDPFSEVAGKGISKLRANGIDVTIGVLEEACKASHKRFFTFHTKKRPFIILKWAESQDGFLSPKNKNEQKPVWLTNVYSRQLVHKMRSEEMAILVGKQTVLDDNPTLNTRDWFGKNPIRLYIDKENKIPEDVHLKDKSIPTICFTSEVQKNQTNLDFEILDFNQNVPKQICQVLFKRNIQSVIIEGGSFTLQQFINADLWDEAFVFKSSVLLNEGTKAPLFNNNPFEIKSIINDQLFLFKNY